MSLITIVQSVSSVYAHNAQALTSAHWQAATEAAQVLLYSHAVQSYLRLLLLVRKSLCWKKCRKTDKRERIRRHSIQQTPGQKKTSQLTHTITHSNISMDSFFSFFSIASLVPSSETETETGSSIPIDADNSVNGGCIIA